MPRLHVPCFAKHTPNARPETQAISQLLQDGRLLKLGEGTDLPELPAGRCMNLGKESCDFGGTRRLCLGTLLSHQQS